MVILLNIYTHEGQSWFYYTPLYGRAWYDSGMVAFYLPGGVPVYAFSLILGLGVVSGLAWVIWQAPDKEMAARLDAGLWVLFGGLIGGRIAYVALNWPYFRQHFSEAYRIYLGGLAWAGVVPGALLALLIVARHLRQPAARLADALLPLLATVSVSAWLGCWAEGCAFGPLTSQWWGLPARDEWGALALRWPLQLAGALLTIGLFWLLDWAARRLAFPPGVRTYLAVAGLAMMLLALSLLRADPIPLWRGQRMDTWAALGLGILALLGLAGSAAAAAIQQRKVKRDQQAV